MGSFRYVLPALAVVGVVALAGCGTQTGSSGPTTARDLGLVEVRFDNVGTQAFHATAVNVSPGSLAAQSLTYQDESNFVFHTLSDTFVDVDTTGNGNRDTRFIRFTASVKNNTASSLKNVTLVGVSVPSAGTLYGTDVVDPYIGSGAAASKTLVREMRPTTGFSSINGQLAAYEYNADFVAFTETEAAGLLAEIQIPHPEVQTAFPYGYVVSPRVSSNGRSLGSGQTGIVTIAVRLPRQSSRSQDLVSFGLLYAIATDSTTRVTQAPDQVNGSYAEPLSQTIQRACDQNAGTVVTIGYAPTIDSAACSNAPTLTGVSLANVRIAGTDSSDSNYLQLLPLTP